MILPELGITEPEIQKAIADRKTARNEKNFARSDEIRDQLAQKGIELMDTPAGTDWKIKYDGA
jgi:cysteinyl-tRNA synthetase